MVMSPSADRTYTDEQGAQRAPWSNEQPNNRLGPQLPHGLSAERLCNAIIRDRKDLEPFRANRMAAVQQMVGKNYSDGGTQHEVPVNLISLYVSIMARSLVANNPRVMFSTFEHDQERVIEAMEKWANDEEIVAMNAVETYKRATVDALFCLGIIKIALADPADAAMSGWDLVAGQPFMENVDLDDFVCDMRATRFDQTQYMGCRYRVPIDVMKKLYAQGRDEEWEEYNDDTYNYGGDERIETIGRDTSHREEFEPHTTLWEIYLRRHGLIVTFRDNGGVPDPNKIVRIQKWIGPKCGPYYILSLGTVPGNLMPLAPIMNLIDLHRHYNRGYNKLLRQTKDYKKLLPVRGGQMEEGGRVKQAVDGEVIQADNAETLKEIEFGGPAQSVLTMTDHIRQAFDFVGGNLALLGGRSPQSRTASQDKMLNENASAGVADLQDAATKFVDDTVTGLNWFWWYHPLKVMKSQWSPASMPDMKVKNDVKPADRKGRMPKIKVDAYSLPRQTPQGRLQFITQVLQMITPLMQLAQQQGVMIDVNALLEIFSKYGDEPDLAKIFHFATPPPVNGQGGGQDQGPGMPANTTRTYERYSHGGQGPQQQAADLNSKVGEMAGPVNPNQGAEP